MALPSLYLFALPSKADRDPKIQYFSSVLEVSSCLAHLAILLIMVFVECSSNVLFVLPSCLI